MNGFTRLCVASKFTQELRKLSKQDTNHTNPSLVELHWLPRSCLSLICMYSCTWNPNDPLFWLEKALFSGDWSPKTEVFHPTSRLSSNLGRDLFHYASTGRKSRDPSGVSLPCETKVSKFPETKKNMLKSLNLVKTSIFTPTPKKNVTKKEEESITSKWMCLFFRVLHFKCTFCSCFHH